MPERQQLVCFQISHGRSAAIQISIGEFCSDCGGHHAEAFFGEVHIRFWQFQILPFDKPEGEPNA